MYYYISCLCVRLGVCRSLLYKLRLPTGSYYVRIGYLFAACCCVSHLLRSLRKATERIMIIIIIIVINKNE